MVEILKSSDNKGHVMELLLIESNGRNPPVDLEKMCIAIMHEYKWVFGTLMMEDCVTKGEWIEYFARVMILEGFLIPNFVIVDCFANIVAY